MDVGLASGVVSFSWCFVLGPLGTYSISDMYDLFIIILEIMDHVTMLWPCGPEACAVTHAN